jgi:hypothetical protein
MKDQARIMNLMRALVVITVLVLAAFSTQSVFAAASPQAVSAGNVLYGSYCDGSGAGGDTPYVVPSDANSANQVNFDGEMTVENSVSASSSQGLFTSMVMVSSADNSNGIALLRELGL